MNPSKVRYHEVVANTTFKALTIIGHAEPFGGPWYPFCLSGHTAPTWGFVDDNGNLVPLSSVAIAWSD